MCGLFSLTPGQQVGAVAKWEERVVKIALSRKLGLAVRDAGVLREFTAREAAQSDKGHPGILGQRLESLCGCRQSFHNGDAGKASQTQGRGLPGPRCVG